LKGGGEGLFQVHNESGNRYSGNNESLAVRRAAAWWMAGDPEQYNSERISGYTEEVLQYYQQQ
jgi:hypothetical protein